MRSKLKIVAFSLMFGTAAVAAAQTPTRADAFAAQLREMQALSSTSPYAFKPAPALSTRPDDPVGNESFADRERDMQALSSTSTYAFQTHQPTLPRQAADPEGKESFAQRFAEMQAESSNSGEFGVPGANGIAGGATMVAKPSNVPSMPVITSSK
jgi:hypothetical protein